MGGTLQVHFPFTSSVPPFLFPPSIDLYHWLSCAVRHFSPKGTFPIQCYCRPFLHPPLPTCAGICGKWRFFTREHGYPSLVPSEPLKHPSQLLTRFSCCHFYTPPVFRGAPPPQKILFFRLTPRYLPLLFFPTAFSGVNFSPNPSLINAFPSFSPAGDPWTPPPKIPLGRLTSLT